ncbi:MAG: class I poly(R)-hydroxyalkanoic acid synthase [Steroidobacteraceae bacterium]
MNAQAPNPAQWFADLLAAQRSMLQQIGATGSGPDELAASNTLSPWLPMTLAFLDSQQQAMKQFTEMWMAVLSGWGASPSGATRDRRFAADPWKQDARFDALARTYLAQSDLLRTTLAAAPLDARTKAQWGFVLRQALDALSPANALITNPEALQSAVDSGGASLAQGMRLFIEDFAKGRISLTDDMAFEVGRNVATTRGGVVFENELMQVLQYAPITTQVHKRPLLIVPPCINKFYILDLQPENSLVAHAMTQGHTVFLVSWRNIGPEQGRLRWDDYVEQGVIRAIDVALAISRADRINTLGFCVGGTLLASTLAVMAAKHEDKVASVTLLTTLLDFADTGELGLLVSEESVAARERAIGRGGVMRGRELAQVFAALRANDLIWPYVISGYLKGKAPPAFDLLFWNSDDSNLPGPMFCWYLRNTYLENKLREPGATIQCGVPVDLKTIEIPAFLYGSREDHIVPWQAAYASSRLLGGKVTFVLGGSGHIAGVINPPAKNKRNHWIGKVGPGPEDWLKQAQDVPGSWWPEWIAWLKPHAGAMRSAPKKLGNRQFAPIEAAPGRYVKAKAP